MQFLSSVDVDALQSPRAKGQPAATPETGKRKAEGSKGENGEGRAGKRARQDTDANGDMFFHLGGLRRVRYKKRPATH